MNRVITILLFNIFIIGNGNGQKYFTPAIGGIESIQDGGEYYKVEIPDKSNKEIYDALLTMVQETFKDEHDKILETIDGNSIKVVGQCTKCICEKVFDVKIEVEFKVKDGRYIFLYNKYNVVGNNTGHQIVFNKGSNTDVLTDSQKDGRTYMFNKKGKINMNKICYKQIVSHLDYMGDIFDISDSFNEYYNKSKKLKSGW